MRLAEGLGKELGLEVWRSSTSVGELEKSLREANTCGRETLDMTSLVLMINLT